jgi:hypothetical protein
MLNYLLPSPHGKKYYLCIHLYIHMRITYTAYFSNVQRSNSERWKNVIFRNS